MCLKVRLHVHRRSVWKYYACCIRFTVFTVQYLYCMCHCLLHSVILSHIDILIFTSKLQNLSLSHYFHSTLSIPVSLWNDLGHPVFDGVGPADSKSKTNVFYKLYLLDLFLSSAVFPFSSFFLYVDFVGQGIGCIILSLGFALMTFFNNNYYYYYTENKCVFSQFDSLLEP